MGIGLGRTGPVGGTERCRHVDDESCGATSFPPTPRIENNLRAQNGQQWGQVSWEFRMRSIREGFLEMGPGLGASEVQFG